MERGKKRQGMSFPFEVEKKKRTAKGKKKGSRIQKKRLAPLGKRQKMRGSKKSEN